MKTANAKTGSALILTIVLTVLLAIIGTLFLLMARTEKIATSARSENEELKLCVDSVVDKITQQLASDVPRTGDPNKYYDYPSQDSDKWLANLEPEPNTVGYKWRHISDLYNRFGNYANDVQAEIRDDYPKDINGVDLTVPANRADADGDGVSDSRWVQVPNLMTSKGKPVYAAVRIIDNGGMLNINTGYKFDPCSMQENRKDGSNQMQINIKALSERGATTNPAERLFNERVDASGRKVVDGGSDNTAAPSLADYQKYISNVVLPIEPNSSYTLFDISDELKLRNRYILNYNQITTRIELLWDNAYDIGLRVPRDKLTGIVGSNWAWRVNDVLSNSDPNYDYRHITTTYNMDRLIDPNGKPMLSINNADVNDLYTVMLKSYDSNSANIPATVKDDYAQVAVNLKDYRDTDSSVSSFQNKYYGLERPLICISEVARRFVTDNAVPPVTHRSYAVEIYKQPGNEIFTNDWRLFIPPVRFITLSNTDFSGGGYYVIRYEDPAAILDVNSTITRNITPIVPPTQIIMPGDRILLLRQINVGGVLRWVVADDVNVPTWFGDAADPNVSFQRDMRPGRWIQRFWDPDTSGTRATSLGNFNTYQYNGSIPELQVFLADGLFRNVGDIGLMFRKPVYYPLGGSTADVIGYSDLMRDEKNVRFNIDDPCAQPVFQYITAMTSSDPNARVKGRININTAPWFVIKQLPWVSQRVDGSAPDPNYALAKSIVAYRDKTKPDANGIDFTSRHFATAEQKIREVPGFASIGELTTVKSKILNPPADANYSMWYYALIGRTGDQIGFPDLTTSATATGDAVTGDFEKRNLIFSRISDLVTVRSDVFTAYILVRLGPDGPQHRVMVILDRSESPSRPVKILAFQPVPDAR